MKKNDFTVIDAVLKMQESSTLEFKAAYNKEQIARVICSFLNNQGGQVVVGVDETGQLLGVSGAEGKVAELSQFLVNEIVPEAAISVALETRNKKSILIINVWKGTKQPYIFQGTVYFRRGSSTTPASTQQLAALIHQDTGQSKRWETQKAIEAEVDDIDLAEVAECIGEASASGRETNIPQDPLQFLSKYGLYKSGDFNNAAILLFGKNPVRLFPQARVRLSVFKSDKTGEMLLYDRLFEKNLFQTVNHITEFFDLAYGVSSSFKQLSWKREDKMAFPRLAIREAILNALIHRDYSSHSSSVAINIYPEKLQISSYGKLPPGLTVSALSKDHLSVPTNPDIAHVFFLRKWIEKIGIGTLKMIAHCKDGGFEIPSWKVSGTSVTVTFPGISVPFDYSEGITEGLTEGLNNLIQEYQREGITEGLSGGITQGVRDSLLEIIKLLTRQKSLRASEISDELKTPYKTIERHIKLLKTLNAIKYIGSKRAGGYQLSEFWNSQSL